jgi:hypothetical protein
MFDLNEDDRLSAWSDLRKRLNTCNDPLQEVTDFWSHTPFVPHNHRIDPFYQASWPTPWEIIIENRYDDFTKAVMIGYTLLLTEKFKNSEVQIKTLVDTQFKRLYNVVYVDNSWALNYDDSTVLRVDNIPSLYSLENLVELKRPR